MSKKLIILAALALPTICQATNVLAAKITAYPSEVIQGCPVVVTAEYRNISTHEVAFAYGQDGFSTTFSIRRVDGKPVPRYSGETVLHTSTFEFKYLAQNESKQTAKTLCCMAERGEYIVQFVAASAKPVFKERQRMPSVAPEFIWSGEAKSEEVHIKIVEPSGIDEKVFEESRGYPSNLPSLLIDYPTSTYAAYKVWHISGAEGIDRSDPAKIVADRSKDWPYAPLQVINLLEKINVPYDVIDGKKIGGEIHGKVAIAWREKWFGIVLKAHPDIWFADQLKLRTAIDQLTLKNYQAAQAELEAIAKDDKAPMAGKAKEYLGLMKQKGWTKESSVPTAPQAGATRTGSDAH